MQEASRWNAQTDVRDQVKRMFSEVLADDGYITAEEFDVIVRQIDPSMPQEQVEEMAKIFFAGKGRKIDIDDFIQWVFSSERGQEREEKNGDFDPRPSIASTSMESGPDGNTTALVVTSLASIFSSMLDSPPEEVEECKPRESSEETRKSKRELAKDLPEVQRLTRNIGRLDHEKEQNKRIEDESTLRQQEIQKKMVEEDEIARKAKEQKRRSDELRLRCSLQEIQKKVMEEKEHARKAQEQEAERQRVVEQQRVRAQDKKRLKEQTATSEGQALEQPEEVVAQERFSLEDYHAMKAQHQAEIVELRTELQSSRADSVLQQATLTQSAREETQNLFWKLAVVEVEKDEAVARISAEKEEAIARISVEKEEAVARISAEKEEAIARISAEKEEAVTRMSALEGEIVGLKAAAWEAAQEVHKMKEELAKTTAGDEALTNMITGIVQGLGLRAEGSVKYEMTAAIEISSEEAAAREWLRHYYEETGLGSADYEVFRRLLDLTERREAREQMLARKNKHLQRYLESIFGILGPLKELKELVIAALAFEASVGVEQNRFSGSAVHFFDEEKFRRSFTCQFLKLVDSVIENISTFEGREKQKFMYHGVDLRLVLRAIQGQKLELVGRLGDESGLEEVSAVLHIGKENTRNRLARYTSQQSPSAASTQSPSAGSARVRSLSASRCFSPKDSKDWRRYIERSESANVLNGLNEALPQQVSSSPMSRSNSRLRTVLSDALYNDKTYSSRQKESRKVRPATTQAFV